MMRCIGVVGVIMSLLIMLLGVIWQVNCDAGRWRCCVSVWAPCPVGK